MRFQFIYEHRNVWPIKTQCRVLQVTRAAYYKFLKPNRSESRLNQAKIVSEIKRIHSLHKRDNYGSPRMHQELHNAGIRCCENTVAKLMKREGVRAKVATKFKVVTTNSNHNLPTASNRLGQAFQAQKPNEVWLTDFTYIHSKEGFSYLCTVQDLYSRKIVGWAVGIKIDTALALEALHQAIALRKPNRGLIVHSDRGSQFAGLAYRSRLDQHGLIQSMSRKGNCYDNAPMESFFKSLKTEEVYQTQYETHQDVARGATDYIERFSNSNRLHSALGFQSPADFERCSAS